MEILTCPQILRSITYMYITLYIVCVSICTCAYVLMLASKVRDCISILIHRRYFCMKRLSWFQRKCDVNGASCEGMHGYNT